MKKLGMLLALTAFILSFNSCSKDDDDDFSMVGTWQQEKLEITVSMLGIQDYVHTRIVPTTFVFNSDGTGSATYEEDNTMITDTFSWNLSGSVLTISDSDLSMTLNLTTMTNSKVVGEQSLTIAQLAELAAMVDLDEEELEGLALLPNLTADLAITLVK